MRRNGLLLFLFAGSFLPARQATDPAVLLRSGRNQEALAAVQNLLKSNPKEPRLLAIEGIALAALGNEGAALSSYRRALSFSPNYLPALEGAAQIEYKNNDPHALASLNRLIQLNSNDQTARAMRAALEVRTGNCAHAVDDYQDSGAVIENQPSALRQYGSCLFRLARWNDAIHVFTQVLAIAPQDSRAAYGLASAQLEAGEAEQALAVLRPFPNDAEALALSAKALEEMQRIPEAVATLRSAILADPSREDFYTQFAELCFAYKSYQAGIDVVDAGLTKLPQSAQLHITRGVLLVQQGNYDAADKDFAAAESINPLQAVSADASALTLVQENRLDAARKLLEQQLKQHPKDAQLQYFMADVLSRQGDFKASLSYACKAVELRPDYLLAHDLLGRLYMEKGDNERAIEESRAALKIDPYDETAIYRWIRILRSRHLSGEATTLTQLSAQWARAREEQRNAEMRESQYRIVTGSEPPNR